jgi:hypothetical protein
MKSSSTIHSDKGSCWLAQEERLRIAGMGQFASCWARSRRDWASCRRVVVFPLAGAPRMRRERPFFSKIFKIELSVEIGSSDGR